MLTAIDTSAVKLPCPSPTEMSLELEFRPYCRRTYSEAVYVLAPANYEPVGTKFPGIRTLTV